MTSMEITDKDLPGDLEIQLKLKKRSTEELILFQHKLRQPRYKNNRQALAIRFYLIRLLLTRHMLGDNVAE